MQVTDPYATNDEPSTQQPQPVQQQEQPEEYGLPLPEQHHPQYVDVAASSLKAMIDPSLEDTPNIADRIEDLEVHHGAQIPTQTDTTEADNINETIMKALRNTDEQVQGL